MRDKLLLAIAAGLFLLATSPVFATSNQDHTCQGNADCSTGNTTVTNNPSFEIINAPSATSQAIGQGGDGGNAISGSSSSSNSTSGAVAGASSNNHVDVDANSNNINLNSAGNANTSSGDITGNVVSIEGDTNVTVNAAALAGLANSECVLSNTESVGVSLGMGGQGIGVTAAEGHTSPYLECNTREAVKVLSQLSGRIDGQDVSLIVVQMTKQLSGVQEAIDQLNGKTQTAYIPVGGKSTFVGGEDPGYEGEMAVKRDSK